eukprot:5958868-Prymnesium_polylepis.1
MKKVRDARADAHMRTRVDPVDRTIREWSEKGNDVLSRPASWGAAHRCATTSPSSTSRSLRSKRNGFQRHQPAPLEALDACVATHCRGSVLKLCCVHVSIALICCAILHFRRASSAKRAWLPNVTRCQRPAFLQTASCSACGCSVCCQ